MKLLGFFVLFTIFAIGMSYVYAEETEDTVIVPFEFNSKIEGYNDKGNYVVEYDPKIIDLQTIFNGTDSIPDPVQGSTKVNQTESTPEPIVEEKPEKTILTPFEERKEYLENKTELTSKQKEELALLENLAECRRGYAESRGVVTDEFFPISYTWINDGEAWLKSYDYSGKHLELLRGIEECQAIRTILNPVTLGPVYFHKGLHFGETQLHHSNIADKVPTWSQERVNVESNIGRDPNAGFCDNDYISLLTKQAFGCIVYQPGEIINPKRYVEYQNDVEDKFNQYKLDGGEAQAKQIMKEQLQKKLQQLQEVQRKLEALR